MIFKKIDVNGVQIFYRECGAPDKPVMLLLHGFPSASHMFRDLMPLLEDKFHLIAPDYPGFGQSESTARETFEYTFDHINRNFWQSGGKMILRSSGQELNLLKKICRMRRLFR